MSRDPAKEPQKGDEWTDDDVVVQVTIVGTHRIMLENKTYDIKLNYALTTFRRK